MIASTLNSIMTIRAGLKRMNKCCFDVDVPQVIIDQISNNATYASHENQQVDCLSADIDCFSLFEN